MHAKWLKQTPHAERDGAQEADRVPWVHLRALAHKSACSAVAGARSPPRAGAHKTPCELGRAQRPMGPTGMGTMDSALRVGV